MLILTEFIFNFVTTKILVVVLNWFVAFMVISARSAIHSILFLIGLFIISAIMFIGFFGLNFIGVLFIIVYVGAVTVLFLFIIMIIPLKDANLNTRIFNSVTGVIPTFLVILAVAMFIIVNFPDSNIYEVVPAELSSNVLVIVNDLEIVGKIIYYDYSFALVVAALLLFIALILAILLCYEI